MFSDILHQLFRTPSRTTMMFPDGKIPPVASPPCTVPLDPDSPWPKFRANALQNGRSPVLMEDENKGGTPDLQPWEFRTSKGVFSSPVIDGEGNIYIGSADHFFYALDPAGRERWRFSTKDIIDASALLDNQKRLYFGSGDGHVYCLDRESGTLQWKFRADTPGEVSEKYGIKTYNLDWFEGNTAMLADGTLLVPNDNYLVYALDRETGRPVREYLANEMIWSSPAVNPDTGRLFFSSCFFAVVNTFCYDGFSGKKEWTTGGLGTVSASPLLTSGAEQGAVVVGGFDGFVRAFSQQKGSLIWKFGTRDHIYASPAQLSDGTIIQPSADGTVYALNPATGRAVWTFETSEPIRSSPAVDGRDRIYFGSGEGRLYCIEKDGSFRWAYQCADGNRNDLNGSPALGPFGVVIGGENGGIHFIPYDYPLSDSGREDPRSFTGMEALLPPEGSYLLYSDAFGRVFPNPSGSDQIFIPANAPITLVHYVRKGGKTILSAIDPRSLKIDFAGAGGEGGNAAGKTLEDGAGGERGTVQLSANRKFITLSPRETWTIPDDGPDTGELRFRLRCTIRTGLRRFGLKFFGGRRTHSIDREFVFQISPRNAGEGELPWIIPQQPGDPGSVLEISRFSCPRPTMLPSYNQIGFDSLHYLAGFVKGDKAGESSAAHAVLWAVQGRLNEKTGETEVDPTRRDFYVLDLEYDRGLLTLSNYEGFTISFFGSWDMPFGTYRIAASVEPENVRETSGGTAYPGAMTALIKSGDIKLYGNFLKLTGMSDLRTGHMPISGGVDVGLWSSSPAGSSFAGRLTVTMEIRRKSASAFIEPRPVKESGAGFGPDPDTEPGARLDPDEHVYGILMVDSDTGTPVRLDYARRTSVISNAEGRVTEVRLDYRDHPLAGKIRGYLMIDTSPVFRQDMSIG